MGIPGLTRWLEGHDCTRVVKRCDGEVHHLCIDINGVCHASLDDTCTTPQKAINSIVSAVLNIIAVFTPSQSLAVMFDGPAPIAKLEEQRKRRRTAPNPPKNSTFSSNMMTTGSLFMLELERALIRAIRSEFHSRSLAIGFQLSGTTVPGEGETKIAKYFSELAASKGYAPDQRIAVVTTDSDLALCAMGCTAFDDFLLVNPYNFVTTFLKELLRHWTLGGSARWSFSASQLPSARRDFVLIMSFSGGDHYPGVGTDVFDFWNRYRKIRHTNHKAPCIVQPDLSITTETLKDSILGRTEENQDRHRGKSSRGNKGKASAGPGNELLRCALWNTRMLLSGNCPDYALLFRGDAPKPANLRAAMKQLVQHGTNFVLVPGTCPSLPLEVFVILCTERKWLPSPLQLVMEEKTNLVQRLHRTSSPKTMCEIASELVGSVQGDQWENENERSLLRFGDVVFFAPETPSTDEPAENPTCGVA